jgi:hypothetical protein
LSGFELTLPNFLRIMLHPARLREDLGKFSLLHRHDGAGVVKQQGAAGGGALV